MKLMKGREMRCSWSVTIQSQTLMSLSPGMVIVTCFSAEIDLAMKKSCAAFSKSIMTAGEISPAVKTGAFMLVGLTVAISVVMVWDLAWVIHYLKSLKKEDGGDVGEGSQTVGSRCEMGCILRARALGMRLSRIGSCLATAVVHMKRGSSSFD